ncbi:MAG TPA: bifunctional nuclease family protein [Candidatus Dormibacteraeota bacterium]
MIRVERPQDLVPMRVTGVRVHPATQQHVVILETEDGATSLPIWIGPPEATGIAVHLEGQPTERPLTHDLMASLCGAAELRVESVAIWRSPESPMVFLAAIEVDAVGRHQLLDARPSDAINLALRTGAGIAVSAETLARAGVPAAEVTTGPPQAGRTVDVVTEDGESLGSAALYVDPAVGNQAQLFRAFEVTTIEASDTVRVRELAELKRIAVFPRAPQRPRH